MSGTFSCVTGQLSCTAEWISATKCWIMSCLSNRICVGACLPEGVLFQLDCQGWSCSLNEGDTARQRRTMHVQGISHWAPANIGPYSQATEVWFKLNEQFHLITYSFWVSNLISGRMFTDSMTECSKNASLLHLVAYFTQTCEFIDINELKQSKPLQG